MKLCINHENDLLQRVDWGDDFFASTTGTKDGLKYAARTSMIKLKTGKAWFWDEITGLDRLAEFPREKTEQ